MARFRSYRDNPNQHLLFPLDEPAEPLGSRRVLKKFSFKVQGEGQTGTALDKFIGNALGSTPPNVALKQTLAPAEQAAPAVAEPVTVVAAVQETVVEETTKFTSEFTGALANFAWGAFHFSLLPVRWVASRDVTRRAKWIKGAVAAVVAGGLLWVVAPNTITAAFGVVRSMFAGAPRAPEPPPILDGWTPIQKP